MPRFKRDKNGCSDMAKYITGTFGDISKYRIKNNKGISAIFLAGAPGAGKTEFLDTIFGDLKEKFIIINIDKYRKLFKGYFGDNSSKYQKASVRVAEKILKFCFKERLNFVFDGTFRNFNKIRENFGQCEKYNRKSLITLVYQEPRLSYYYTFLRKLQKRRNVPIQVFIDGFYDSIFNVFRASRLFTNTNIMIAHKRYTFFDKDLFSYNIDYKTDNIASFCFKYNILYKRGEFQNREKLRLDIESYTDILLTQLSGKGTILGDLKIYLLEKLWKLF